jgi:hypothetical protein
VKWKSAIDWLFCSDWGIHHIPRGDRIRRYRLTKASVPLDMQLDSPCPRWVLNALLCDALMYRQRIKLVLKHHQMVSGQKINTNLLQDDILKEIRIKKHDYAGTSEVHRLD